MSPAGIDWQQYIDAYCERTSPAFWAEPLNAVTNAAFLVAAFALALRLRTLTRAGGGVHPSLWLLVLLLASIGVGSFLFHTFARRWASLADVLPIYLFMHAYAACFLRWRIGWRWRVAWLGAPAFLLFAQAVALVVPPATLGMGGYAPALLALAGFALWLWRRADERWRALGGAALLFALSLTLRQSDLPLCEQWPLGTHFLWHLLNALVLYVVTRALLPPPPRSAA